MKNYLTMILWGITYCSLISCGQKGPLILPEKQFIIEQKNESLKPNAIEKDN